MVQRLEERAVSAAAAVGGATRQPAGQAEHQDGRHHRRVARDRARPGAGLCRARRAAVPGRRHARRRWRPRSPTASGAAHRSSAAGNRPDDTAAVLAHIETLDRVTPADLVIAHAARVDLFAGMTAPGGLRRTGCGCASAAGSGWSARLPVRRNCRTSPTLAAVQARARWLMADRCGSARRPTG